MIHLKCEKCGIDYEKPADFKKWHDRRPTIFLKWNLVFCDTCRKDIERKTLKKLPDLVKNMHDSPIFSIDDIKEVYDIGRAHELNGVECTSSEIGKIWTKVDYFNRNIKWD